MDCTLEIWLPSNCDAEVVDGTVSVSTSFELMEGVGLLDTGVLDDVEPGSSRIIDESCFADWNGTEAKGDTELSGVPDA